MKKKELQTIRLWSPLYPGMYHGLFGSSISTHEIVRYQDKIQAAIKRDTLLNVGERGLAVHISDGDLNEKVDSIFPSVEQMGGKLWAVTEVKLFDELTEEEYIRLTDVISEQLADEWGAGFGLRHIEVPEGDLSIDFGIFGKTVSFFREEEFTKWEMENEIEERYGMSMDSMG